MDPTFIDGRSQEYTAASGAIIVVAVRAGRGLFLDSIATTDETWVHYFTPKSKRSSMQRLLPKRHPQASGPLAQVYRKAGRLC
jgi:hypothetical protein